MQNYSDPTRKNDPYSLPDIEIYFLDELDCKYMVDEDNESIYNPGWYWHSCFPGCLPDSDPMGPHNSYLAALIEARQDNELDDLDLSVWYVYHDGKTFSALENYPPQNKSIVSYIVTYSNVMYDQIMEYWTSETKGSAIKPIYYAY